MSEPIQAERLRQAVLHKAPQKPAHFKTVAHVARFERAPPEFDQVLLDLALASSPAIQQGNFVVLHQGYDLKTGSASEIIQNVTAWLHNRSSNGSSRGGSFAKTTKHMI